MEWQTVVGVAAVKSELPLSGRDAYDGPIANDQRDERGAMELYTAGTGNGQRAAIAVNECGVRCTMHVLNLAQGDQKKPDYLKINPTARREIQPDGMADDLGREPIPGVAGASGCRSSRPTTHPDLSAQAPKGPLS